MLPKEPESGDYRKKMSNPKKTNAREKAISGFPWQQSPSVENKRHKITPPSCCHLCGVVAFLLVSVLTAALAAKYPVPTNELRNLLGQAPPAIYINSAFAIYIVSEVFYIILRIGQEGSRKFALQQLMFFSGFYFFFWCAEMLQAHFILLAVSGIVLQILESFRRAHSCKIAKENNYELSE